MKLNIEKNKWMFYYLASFVIIGVMSPVLQMLHIAYPVNIFILIFNVLITIIETLYFVVSIFVIGITLYRELPKLYLISPIAMVLTIGVIGPIVSFCISLVEAATNFGDLVNNPWSIAYTILVYTLQIIVNVFLLIKFKYVKFN